jgi:hypothetical protein
MNTALRLLRQLPRELVDGRAEVSTALSIAAGWVLLTHGIASLLPNGQVWPISSGLFLLSATGWRFLYTVARDGLYALTRDERRRG